MRNIHSGTLLSLAPVETNTAEDMHKTFQQYSQAQSQKSRDAAEPEISPKKYKRLLDKYPEVLKENFKIKTPKHGVVHTIQTGNCSPCQYCRFHRHKKHCRVGFPFVLQMRSLRYKLYLLPMLNVPHLARSNALFVEDSWFIYSISL